MRFSGKSVLVTGAASGIGRATAILFAAEGAQVTIGDVNDAGLAETASMMARPARIVPYDAVDHASCHRLVAAAAESGLDVVCNIGGIHDWGPSPALDESRFERSIAINLTSLFAICRTALPHLVESGGNIVNVASAAGMVGVAYNAAYCAAKHGLIGYADSLRLELSPHNISVIGVTPGSIRTDVSRNAITADGGRRGESDAAIDSGIDPDDFAERMISMIDAGQREVMIADAPTEKMIGEARRTPEELIDRMIEMFNKGYAAQMGVKEK